MKGCANNRSQKTLHQKFEELLQRFTFEKSLSPIFKKMFLHLLSKRTEVNEGDKKALRVELATLKNKLDNLEERFVTGEIDQTLYAKFRDKFRTSIQQIELELDNSQNQLSNLEKSVEKCILVSEHDGGPHHDGSWKSSLRAGLAFGLAARIGSA